MPEPHRFAGTYHATQPIPAWEKGSKLSDTSEDDFKDGYYDSSDVSAGGSSDTDGDADQEPASFDADEAIASLVQTSDKTPVKQRDIKGKGRQILPDELMAPISEFVDVDHDKATSKSKSTIKQSASTAAGRTHTHRPYRPRSGSSSRPPSRKSASPLIDDAHPSTSISSPRTAAGPAAQSFSDFTKQQPSIDLSSTSSRQSFTRVKAAPISSVHPLRDAAPVWGQSPSGIPTRTHGRGLDRARSAPMSVFGGPDPSPRTPSTRQHATPLTSLQTPKLRPHSPDPECECWRCDPSVQAAKEAERVIDEAKLRSDGQVCLDSRSLTYVPECIADIDKLVAIDKHTAKIRPLDIHLFLASNALTEEGLPRAMWDMRNIVQLGLRFNQIREVPQSIGNMPKLQKLILFNNKLRWLPAEILKLGLDTLVVGSNPFVRMPTAASVIPAIEAAPANQRKHICEQRRPNFRVPSLLEVVTRKLLEPVPESRRVPSLSQSLSPNHAAVKRYFHVYKDEATSPRVGSTLLPPHLLKPFIPLMRPNLPQHLVSQAAEFDRSLLSPSPSTPGGSDADGSLSAVERRSASCGNTRDLLLCSVCESACGEMAETRIEWRRVVAGITLASEDAKQEWVPILWRGCSTQCLDFLDQ